MSQKKILVMEHNEKDQRLLRVLISHLGYEPLIICNENECLLTAKKDLPDLLLINTEMPLTGGILNLLRDDDKKRRIPAIAIVGSATTGNKINGLLAQGYTDYISKPLNIKGLDDAIQRALSGA